MLLPFLFWLNATLAWIVLVCACIITLIILAYLRPMRVVFKRVIDAETRKHSALGETIFGIKTVKSLALEPQRKALWDERVAEAGKWRLAFGKLSNWPQTLVTPIERFMWMGVILVGAYLAMTRPAGLHGRQPVRLHDAVAARRAAAGRPGPADRGLRRSRRRDRPGRVAC